jgi:RNA polymerase sigma-70 factor (ECF subfamily)
MVLRLQRGETKVEDEIYGVFYAKIYGHIYKKINDHDETATLVDDVSAEIQHKIGLLKKPTAFVSWCNQITNAKAIDRYREIYREKDRKKKGKVKRSEPAYKRRKWTEEEKQLFTHFEDQIPPKQMEIMKLHYLKEMPIEQIAAATGLKVGTVKSRLYYGRQALLQRIRPDGVPGREE